jgi:hypothetical protein
MKPVLMAALIAAQLSPAQPLMAASLDDDSSMASRQRGAFVGARLRVPFGGAESGQPRATLAAVPMEHGFQLDGRVRSRLGEGFELGLGPRNRLRLTVGGATFAERLAAAQGQGQGQEQGEEQAEEQQQGQEERPRRRRTTGQHILRGAAVAGILAAAAIGGLFLFIGVACDGGRCDE